MPRRRQTLGGKIWVTGVTLLIAFIAFSSQIFVIWPWYGSTLSVDLIFLLGPFNLLVAFLYWNYILCVYTDPGSVPKGWEPDFTSEEGFEVKALNLQPRYCKYCECYKPPRAHHCKQCKRCVLRMDHHCPWTDNCIGHYNYAHFIRFLCAVDLACSYNFLMVSRRIWYGLVYQYWDPAGSEVAWIVANYVACIPVIAAVGVFSLYHIYCLLTNTTTVESWEKDKVTRLVRRGKISEVKFPYNLGLVANFNSVFGSNPLFWCWPLRRPNSNGLIYPVAEGSVITEQYSWPPKDPYAEAPAERIPTGDPWTYGNGDINPNLMPSNTRKRKHAVPPYHPSYDAEEQGSNASTSSSPERDSHSSNEYLPYTSPDKARHQEGWIEENETDQGPTSVRVRRGSEGWEATMPNRWVQVQEEPEQQEQQMPTDSDSIIRGRALHRG